MLAFTVPFVLVVLTALHLLAVGGLRGHILIEVRGRSFRVPCRFPRLFGPGPDPNLLSDVLGCAALRSLSDSFTR